MSKPSKPQVPTFRGRNIGIAILVSAQYIIGTLHAAFGLMLFIVSPDSYSIYTIVYSVLTIVFAHALWEGKRWGWVGTLAVSVFVITADSLTLLNLPSIPGIPRFAGAGEIPYSFIVLLYLLQPHIRAKYR